MHAFTSRRALVAVALTAILVAPLSGCESGDDDAAPGPSASPSASAPPSEPETTEPTGSGEPTGPTEPTGTADPTSSPSEPGTPTSGTEAPIPTDAVDYADALIVAWGSGDHGRMDRLALPDVVETLTGHADPGGPHWDRVGADSGAGSTFVRYENTSTGERLEVRVVIQAADEAQEQAVAEAKFG